MLALTSHEWLIATLNKEFPMEFFVDRGHGSGSLGRAAAAAAAAAVTHARTHAHLRILGLP